MLTKAQPTVVLSPEKLRPCWDTPSSITVLQKRYLKKNASGACIEDPAELFQRVATTVAQGEAKYGMHGEQVEAVAADYLEMMHAGRFIPCTPTLMNAGRKLGLLSACFVLPIGDSIEEIFDTVKTTALIQRAGGGTGFCLDRLRPTGDTIKSSGGKTSGPISFWRVLAETTNAISQGCFIAGTPIGVPGKNKNIESIKKGDIVYSYDFDQNKVVLKRAACDAFKTKENTPVWKLITDKGLVVYGTPDHPVMTRAGKYTELSKLNEGERLMPLTRYTKANGITVHLQDGSDTRVHEHRLVGEFLNGGSLNGLHVHHRDNNHFNNDPTNLQLLTHSQHATLHGIERGAFYCEGHHGANNGMHVSNFWATASDEEKRSYCAKISLGLSRNNPMYDPETVKKHPLFNSKTTKRLAKKGKIIAAACALLERGKSISSDLWVASSQELYNCQRFKKNTILETFGSWTAFEAEVGTRNHRVVSVGFSHLADVYDFEVEDTHSFFVVNEKGCGVAVHNSTRRGANMMQMSVDYPDILKFISAKTDKTQFTNFNISVKVPNYWMKEMHADPDSYAIVVNPRTKKRYVIPHKFEDKISTNANYRLEDLIEVNETNLFKKPDCWTKRQIWDLIVNNAHNNGEPGVIFIDHINAANPTPNVGEMEATNPCGELPLLPWESCNLGSLNLGSFVREATSQVPATEIHNGCYFDFDLFAHDARLATRFLENVVEVNVYPTPEVNKIGRENRKVGLGIMGFADMLFKLGVGYNTEEGLAWGERIMRFMNEQSHNESERLANERGCFANWAGSRWETEWKRKQRNACCTAVAPTGTISMFAGCSGGVEPLFSLAFTREVLPGHGNINAKLHEVNSIFKRLAVKNDFWGYTQEELYDAIETTGSLQSLEKVPEDVKRVFVCAHDIAPEWHIRMQAAFQKHCDSSISKTTNFPHDATVDDVRKIYDMAFELGCKGVTVYRDGCRANQPMALKAVPTIQPADFDLETEIAKRMATQVLKPMRTPDVLPSVRVRQNTAFGHMHINIAIDPKSNRELEVFAQLGKGGEIAAADLEGICRMVSLFLRSGGTLEQVVEQLDGIGSTTFVATKVGRVASMPDGLAKALRRYINMKKAYGLDALLLGKVDLATDETVGETKKEGRASTDDVFKLKCPNCDTGHIVKAEGCERCTQCGYSKC